MRSGLGLLMDKLSANDASEFSFPDDNFKCQWIFTKLGVCIAIVEISGLLITNFFDFDRVFCPNMSVFSFSKNNFSKYRWIFTKLSMCIDIVEICFIANRQVLSFFDRVICPQYIRILLSGQ